MGAAEAGAAELDSSGETGNIDAAGFWLNVRQHGRNRARYQYVARIKGE
jgi:hypothetical protein